MSSVFAVASYRLREALGLRRWWIYPPLFFVATWLAGDPLRHSSGTHDALDLLLNDLGDGRILILLLGGGMLTLTGDALHRSSRTGALPYLFMRCRHRALWWVGELLALIVIALGLVGLFAASCAVAGAIRFGGESSAIVGAQWVFHPQADVLPSVYPVAREWVVVAALALTVSMCVVIGAVTMALSMVVRSAALLPLGAGVLLAVSLQPVPSGLALQLHPVFTAAWLAYVPDMHARSLLEPWSGVGLQAAWLALVAGVGLVASRRYEPR